MQNRIKRPHMYLWAKDMWVKKIGIKLKSIIAKHIEN